MCIRDRSPHVVVGLDDGGGPLERHALDHVRVEGPLREEADARDLPGLLLEDSYEELPDDLPFPLGVLHACEGLQKLSGGVDEIELQPDRVAEGPEDLLRLPGAQKSVVYEDAGEAVADRLVQEHCRYGRVDPPG